MPDAEQEKRKGLKRQLWCAIYAHDAFKNVKEAGSSYVALGLKPRTPLHYTYISSMVVTYARFFTHSDEMVKLPNRFARFEEPRLREAHKAVLEARNIIYAHTDASVCRYNITVQIKEEGDRYAYAFDVTWADIGAPAVPIIMSLCDLQMKRCNEHIHQVFSKLLPPRTIHDVLSAERSKSTSITIRWPKDTDPPGTW